MACKVLYTLLLSRVMALLCVEDPVPHMPDIYAVESALLTLAASNRISQDFMR